MQVECSILTSYGAVPVFWYGSPFSSISGAGGGGRIVGGRVAEEGERREE